MSILSACTARRIPILCRRLGRAYSGPDGDIFLPTTLSKVSAAQMAPVLRAYFTNGFLINATRVMGAVALLPRAFLSWRVHGVREMTPESFALFHLVEPKLDLVVLGTGAKTQRIDQRIIDHLQRKGISVEIQDTPNACATFNFFLDEGRPAGAALIPPDYIPP